MSENIVADLSALHTLAAAYQDRGSDLSQHSTTLAAVPIPAGALGPVGQAFTAALTGAVARQARVARELAIRLHTAGTTAAMTATGYADTDTRSGDRLGTWL